MLALVQMRVAGIGDGLFAIIFVAILSLLICYFGGRTDRPGMFCCIACLMTTIVVLFIVLVPKESSRPVTVAQEFDGNYARRTFITVMLGICALVSGICLLNHFCMVKRQGSRVRDDDRFGLVIV